VGGFASREGNRERPEMWGSPSVKKAPASNPQITREVRNGFEGQSETSTGIRRAQPCPTDQTKDVAFPPTVSNALKIVMTKLRDRQGFRETRK